MVKAFIDVALPEEAAGAAYEIVKKELIEPFADFIGDKRLREHDWSLKGRIQTNGEVIRETIELAGGDKNAVLVKGPGVTPTKEQTQAVLNLLNDARSPEELSKLVTGTPNGYMRGHWLVKGNLERYENPGLPDLLEVSLPVYDRAGKIDVLFLDGGREKDGVFFNLDSDAGVRVDFNRQTVRETEKLSAGSAVYAKVTRRTDVIALCDRAIDKNNDIVFMSKYTVRPELDGEKKKIYNDRREKHGLQRLEGNQGDIVDAAFARLLARPVKRDTTVLAPDPSYGPKIAAVLNAVYACGVKKPVGEFSVCRFSAGKSEYGGLNQVVKEDGEYRLYIGTKEIRIPVEAGDMFEEMHYDYADAARYVAQVFRQAAVKKYNRVVFAFDETDLYDAPVVKAVRNEALKLKKVEGEDFLIMKPDAAAVMMFTAPLPGGTCYAYDNLWGDIVSDAMDLGASIASVNSVILLADGRVWPEMGGAGTAPDLMELSKKEGFLRYDPIPIIEGLAIGFSQASLNEPENRPLRSYAQALHEAYINVLKKGIAPPDLAPKLKSKQKTGVDTASFVKAVRVELLTFLGLKEEAAAQMLELRQTLKEIR
ncbi:MAG: NADP-dependent isocitrate dehydrogenase [Alphaproteobacteria bacterium]|nr:NADP-dependent isocitrate dehydrogenase [Alphaproteobacteria bacterium]